MYRKTIFFISTQILLLKLASYHLSSCTYPCLNGYTCPVSYLSKELCLSSSALSNISANSQLRKSYHSTTPSPLSPISERPQTHSSLLDYLHLTKRFGIVAASQLPIHYLLSVKSPYNLLSLLTSLSHEELNPYHRRLGRILITFFSLHALLYLNFYVQMGFLSKRIRDPDVQLGIAAITSFLIIGTTALSIIRRYSYRIFYVVHVVLSTAILPILYFHVRHIRIYIVETGIVYILSSLQRHFLSRRRVSATIAPIPNTSLMKITLKPSTPIRVPFTVLPGQHVYISLPQTQKSFHPLQSIIMNPYSIANLPTKTSSHINLVVRELSGTTNTLAQVARSSSSSSSSSSETEDSTQHSILLEGPYGAAQHFPNFLDYDAVLLVAGGVGATFTLPIYLHLLNLLNPSNDSILADGEELKDLAPVSDRETKNKNIRSPSPLREEVPESTEDYSEPTSHLLDSSSSSSSSPLKPPNLHFIWCVRTLSDAEWGISAIRNSQHQSPSACKLYITAPSSSSSSSPQSTSSNTPSTSTPTPIPTQHNRPDWKKTIDDIFTAEGFSEDLSEDVPAGEEQTTPTPPQKVAILLCGPPTLGKALRREVGRWVTGDSDSDSDSDSGSGKTGKRKGRRGEVEVWWHAEEFGW